MRAVGDARYSNFAGGALLPLRWMGALWLRRAHYREGRNAGAKPCLAFASPSRDVEKCAGLPLHYSFDAIPVGGNA